MTCNKKAIIASYTLRESKSELTQLTNVDFYSLLTPGEEVMEDGN